MEFMLAPVEGEQFVMTDQFTGGAFGLVTFQSPSPGQTVAPSFTFTLDEGASGDLVNKLYRQLSVERRYPKTWA